jgi:hypothetical protein
MGIKVTFLRDANDTATPAAQATVLVPKAAVVTAGNATHVFIVHGETIEQRAIRVGGTDGDKLEVVAGLSAGDQVVMSPAAILKDGMTVVKKT